MKKVNVKLEIAMNVKFDLYEDENKVLFVNGEELHSWLEVKTDYTKWIKRRIESYGFELESDCRMSKVTYDNNYRGKTEKHIYYLKPDMVKQLTMVEDAEKGKLVRKFYLDMEKFISESQLTEEFKHFRKTGKVARRMLTDSIQDVHGNDTSNYVWYSDLVNKKILGMTAKQYREKHNIKPRKAIRDCLPNETVLAIKQLEDKIKGYIDTFSDMGMSEDGIKISVIKLINK